ncbi:kinase-like domain, phloem protein 2-like protein [Tanacetum coccineum]
MKSVMKASIFNMKKMKADMFRHKEKEINYDWAMECLRSAMDSYMLPRVIVTDRELAFMKAYDTAFLNAKGLLRNKLSGFKEQNTVAFKRLDRQNGQGEAEFYQEIMMLSLYRHEYLISLMGFCKEGDAMILVYEHASNGSLDAHLKSADLTWTQRLKICLQAAKGLRTLHSNALRNLAREERPKMDDVVEQLEIALGLQDYEETLTDAVAPDISEEDHRNARLSKGILIDEANG